MTPEQKARVNIDTLLVQAGWHVCDMADANIHAARGVAVPLPPLAEQHRIVAEVGGMLGSPHAYHLAAKHGIPDALRGLTESLAPVPYEINEIDWKAGLSRRGDALLLPGMEPA